MERPILFSGPMVRAILEGRKTQTRRVVKPQPNDEWCPVVEIYAPTMIDRRGEEYPGADVFGASDENEGRICPYGQPSNHLWVRECFIVGWPSENGDIQQFGADGNELPKKVWYRADDNGRFQWIDRDTDEMRDPPWKPSIHMPRWACRITLEITDVRVQQLQEISEEDAQAEGVEWYGVADLRPNGELREGPSIAYRAGFHDLWDSINSKRGLGWNTNPWVWALTFKRIQ